MATPIHPVPNNPVRAAVIGLVEAIQDWLAVQFPGIRFELFSAISGTLMAMFCMYLLMPGEEGPKRFRVPPPKLPDEDVDVEEATIKCKDSDAIQCYAPATGKHLGFINPSTPDAIDRAISSAATAQKPWSTTTFAARRAVLRSLLQHVLDHQDDICRVACLDSGKTLVDAQLGEIMVTAEKLSWTLKHGEAALSPSRRPTNLLLMYKRNEVRYEPLGVVAALVSWNYPFHNFIGPVISALFAGNAIVVKVSEQTAWSSMYFTSIVRGALVAHGHSPDLVQTVVCWPSTAPHLTSHPGISHLTFIGSKPVCHAVAADAAKSLTPLVAELGGKDPFIITASAKKDMKRIAEIALRGTFQSAGQNCIGIERIVIAPELVMDFVALVAPRIKALRLGPSADVGAMISDASFDRLDALVRDAIVKGATLIAGGKRYAHPDFPKAHYYLPTLLVDVTIDMAIANEECFGPIMTVMTAKDSSAEALLEIANAPAFGLGASVFGKDSDPVVRAIVNGVRSGNVAVNDFATFYAVQLPFGGVGGSGYGRFAGEEGLRGLCNAKSVCVDRMAWLGIRTSIPPKVQYPVADQNKSWTFVKGVVEMGYGLTFGRMFDGLVTILKNM
ncbi:hypothetical protein TD95_004670 [Thielaviopsis punctulata]|uniref:aldehyde dehydrogenase (NAD(+)) n=1 Tax=Thielaviopsis punctulata TaxID=72032 RepID=A0A0F4ZFE5_9PEZI|nr:hypothetical protein TD95_004670 [Thielaviopsis punctulata]